MQQVIMMVGCPASTKGTYVESLGGGFVVLNRDRVGGKVEKLVPQMVDALKKGDSVVLDNTFPTVASRKPFIDAACLRHVPIHCKVMETSLEDAQVNALNRMWDRYGRIFFTPQEIKLHSEACKDSNIFAPVALFHYRKEYKAPTQAEGFASKPEKIPFVRRPALGQHKALILDYDDTLRKTKSGAKYPVKPEDIEILPGRFEKLKKYLDDDWLLLGASNQSGVSKGDMTEDEAAAMFRHTNKLLGIDIPFMFCPHSPVPKPGNGCYCRKPQSGILVYFIRKYELDPAQCIYVGDRTTDATFAKRLGMPYQHPDQFFS